MKLKIGDFLIIIAVISAAILMLVPRHKTGSKAILSYNGEEIITFDLSQNTEYTFEGDYYNKIVIRDGSAYIESADCPDKTCVHSGKISKDGQTICCLPNKMLLRIVSDENETDVIS